MDRYSGYGSSMHGRHGSYGPVSERSGEESAVMQMKKTYWTAKHTLMKKIGKKEDEHMVASDAELDAKLELFRQIEKSSVSLQKVIERYQNRLFILSREENFLGMFLKGQGREDKTRAGKMMVAVGKSECFSAAQRTQLRFPLYRLYQEVETFRSRAVSDTLVTVRRMEEARNEYRGALLWMKDASEELDPDTHKQMEKFRKVQVQVKQAKAKFDKFKLDVMQKVDLLAASRSNMYSHALAAYQSALLAFWESTSRLMTAVSDCFVGYQYYEFSMLKELDEPSRKLVEQTGGGQQPQPKAAAAEASSSTVATAAQEQQPASRQSAAGTQSAASDRTSDSWEHVKLGDQLSESEVDLLIKDIIASVAGDMPQKRQASHASKSTQPLPGSLQQQQQLPSQLLDAPDREAVEPGSPSLIDLSPKETLPLDAFTREEAFGDFQSADAEQFQGGEDSDSEQALLLQEVLGGGLRSSPGPSAPGSTVDAKSDANSFLSDWGAAFNALSDSEQTGGSAEDEEFDLLRSDSPAGPATTPLSYLPSNLLELSTNCPPTSPPAYGSDLFARPPDGSPASWQQSAGVAPASSALTAAGRLLGLGSPVTSSKERGKSGLDKSPGSAGAGSQPAGAARTPKKNDLSPWYNLFADLDPLSNPDAVGKKVVDTSDQA